MIAQQVRNQLHRDNREYDAGCEMQNTAAQRRAWSPKCRNDPASDHEQRRKQDERELLGGDHRSTTGASGSADTTRAAVVACFFVRRSLAARAARFVVPRRLGLAFCQTQRDTTFEGFDAIGLVANVTNLVAFAGGRAFVVQEVAKLAQCLTVGVRHRFGWGASGRRLLGNADRDARRKLRFTLLLVRCVAHVVARADRSGALVRIVAKRTERLASCGSLTVGFSALSFASV